MTAAQDDIIFRPPIADRPTSELFAMIGNTEHWHPFARAQAESVLRMRGIELEEINAVKVQGGIAIAEGKKDQELEMKRRRTESYSIREMLFILFTWPVLVGIEMASHHFIDVTGKGLWTLSAEKYWRKFWQRCALILASMVLYAFLITTVFG